MQVNTHSLIGKRIEIPIHYDMWMQGARCGLVTAFRQGKPGQSAYVLVKTDHPSIRLAVKLWRLDWDYVKVLD